MAIHHNKRQLTVRKIANYISLPCRWGSTLWMRRQWHCGCHKATNLRQYRQVGGAREMCVHVFYRHCHRKAAAGNQRQALGNKRLQNLEKPNWKSRESGCLMIGSCYAEQKFQRCKITNQTTFTRWALIRQIWGRVWLKWQIAIDASETQKEEFGIWLLLCYQSGFICPG